MGTYDVAVVPGSIFGGIASFSFDDGTLFYDADFPDRLNTFGGSSAALTYSGGGGGTAGVVFDGSFKVVNFGFPFETVTSPARRAELMSAIVGFFDVGTNGPGPSEFTLESRDPAGNLTPPPAYVEDGTLFNNDTVKSTVGGLIGLGSRYVEYDVPNTGTDNATFVPEITVPGKYEVFLTWGSEANCFNAQFAVNHHHGQETQLLHQLPDTLGVLSNANRWVSLGEYWFAAGQGVTTTSVNVSEETITGQPDGGYPRRLYVDAARWARLREWPRGDYNDDDIVDLADFTNFDDCLSGPDGGYLQPDCEEFDFDVDGDVDLGDFGGFQEAFAGS